VDDGFISIINLTLVKMHLQYLSKKINKNKKRGFG